ncbi:MAG TPA: hypothetical protein VI818_01995 [Candidatus Thermoplasmatota archaeon]|nr:hypothetical protein [Candidatus Thermoplasmatota archaeon]
MRILLVSALVVVAALAGCADPAPLAPAAATDGASNAPATGSDGAPLAPGARPVWTHGDWFEINVKVDLGFGTLIDGKQKLVVGRADKAGYELSPATRGLGIVDAHFNDFYVGPLDPDLNGPSGHQSKPFRLFDWPLEVGKIWASDIIEDPLQSANYVQAQFTVAEAGNVPDPKGDAHGYVVQGKTANGYFVNYTYSSQAKWLTKYEKRDAAGTLRVFFDLVDYGNNYTGEFHTITKKDLYVRFMMNPFWVFDTTIGPVPPADQFTVNQDFTFLQEIIFLFTYAVPKDGNVPEIAAPGVMHVETLFPDNTNKEYTLADTGNKAKFHFKDHEPYKKGTYTVGYGMAGLAGAFVGYFGFTDVVTQFSKSSHANHGM